MLPLLEENLSIVAARAKVSFTIKNENYITSQCFATDSLFREDENLYDYVIGNPPYLKVPKEADEAKAMSGVCYGAPQSIFLVLGNGHL